MRGDFVSVIEAAYATAPSDEQWLAGIAQAALPCLDAGLGLNIYTYDARNPADFRVLASARAGDTPMDGAAIESLVRSGPPEMVERAYTPGPPMYFSQFAREGESDHVLGVLGAQEQLKQVSPDVLAIRGSDPSMRGCLMTTLRPAPGRLAPTQARLFACLGAHLAAGWRLRQERIDPDATDAVLDGRGRLVHARAEDAAAHKVHLERAFAERQRARGAVRSDNPPAAVTLWQAMVQGEWTLINHVDTDGKRFVLARRNRADVGDPGALTLRERQVAAYASFGFSLKHIAYELGLALPTVSEHLKGALRKLRLSHRGELVALFGRGGSNI